MADTFNTLTAKLFELTLPPLKGYRSALALAPDTGISKWDLSSLNFYHSRWLEASQQEWLADRRLRSDRVADLNQAINSIFNLVRDAEAFSRLVRGHADWFGGLDDLDRRADTVRDHLNDLGVARELSLSDPAAATKLVQEPDPWKLEFDANRLAETLVRIASRARDKCRSYIRQRLDELCDPRRITADWVTIVQRNRQAGEAWKRVIENIAGTYKLKNYTCAAVPPPPLPPGPPPPGPSPQEPDSGSGVFGPPAPDGDPVEHDFFPDPVPPFGEGWAQAAPSAPLAESGLTAGITMPLAQILGMNLQGDELLDAPIEWVHGAEAEADATREPAERGAASEEAVVLGEALAMLRAQTDDIAASAFDAYADAMTSAVETGHSSAAGIGKAMRASAKQSLLSIGQQASVKGAFEVAESVSSYADHHPGPAVPPANVRRCVRLANGTPEHPAEPDDLLHV